MVRYETILCTKLERIDKSIVAQRVIHMVALRSFLDPPSPPRNLPNVDPFHICRLSTYVSQNTEIWNLNDKETPTKSIWCMHPDCSHRRGYN